MESQLKNRILTTTLAGITALTLTACGGSESTPSSDSATQGNGSGANEPLIVYTNSNSDGRAEWLTEKAKENGFEIQIVGQGGTDTTNKLIAEKGNPVADVAFGLNNMYFEQLEAEDILVDYTPAWSDEVDGEMGDADDAKSYWPIVQQGIVLAYNADKLKGDKAPKDWRELTEGEKFKGRYQTETGLGGATTALVLAGILSQFKDEAGEFGVSEEGWKAIEHFFSNGSPAVPDKDLFARMKDDEVDMGQMWTSGIPKFEEEYGINSDVARPEVGVPYAVEQVAIINGTNQQDKAEEFIDWFGSAEVQAEWSEEFTAMPANKGAIEKADKDIVEFHESLKPQEIDWEFVTKNMGDWIEKIELEYL